MAAMWLQDLLLGILAMEASAQGPSETEFISIDCGLETNSSYSNPYNGLLYASDNAFIDTGVNRRVSSDTNLTGLHPYYSTLRSFPTGARNCYTLGPVRRGGRYLVRAEFEYGNYDGTNLPPTFDLYLGVNKWQTVPPEDFSRLEIIAIAPSESLQVCLVDIGLGTPFISSLELRPLLDTMYTMANETHSLVLYEDRLDHGRNGSMRYPDDHFDRVWFATTKAPGFDWLSTDRNVSVEAGDLAVAPPAVFMTAVTTNSIDRGVNFSVNGSPGEKTLVFLYFAEIEEIGANQTRELAVFLNDRQILGPYVPTFLIGQTVLIHKLGSGGTSNYSVRATDNSTLPPILNGREVYKLVDMKSLPTDEGDVAAMIEIKRLYGVKKNWNGDPCVPQNISWEGLNCSYSDIQNPRITALNLSQSGISGIIAPSIANLTVLVSLDLSGNNLTGEIPTTLGELLQLKVPNLENNQLSGEVPKIFNERSQNQTLRLSTDGNTKLCNKMDSCEIINGKAKHIVPIVVGISVAAIVLFGIFILVWRLKGRKQDTVRSELQERRIDNSRDNIGVQVKRRQQELNLESHEFTFSEIINITQNFEHIIGRGSFGIVYHGLLNDGREAAVKMLSKSSQGAKEFHAEAQILSRVHHKNQVYLLGYCDDKNNLALV